MAPEPEQNVTEQAMLAGVAVQATRLIEVSEALVKQMRMSTLERIFVIGMATLVALMSAGLIWIGLSNRDNTRATKRSIAVILDCTQPTGKCYQRGLSSQARAVTAIVKSNLASAWCSVHSLSFVEAEHCVARLTKS